MKKKGDVSVELLVGIAAFAVILVVAFLFLRAVGITLGSESNKEIVYNWVQAKSLVETVDFTPGEGVVVADTPPVIDLGEPIEIENDEDLLWQGDKPPKAYKEIANSMVDCWSAFHRGQKDFMNAVEKETFCFPCRAILFGEDIKKDRVKMIGFNKYLSDTKTRSTGTQTYLQYLANDNLVELEPEELQNEIVADTDLHIMFFAASGRGILNILSNVALGADVSEEETGTGYLPGATGEPGYGELGITSSERAEVAGAAGTALATKSVIGRIAAQGVSSAAAKKVAEKTAERALLSTAGKFGARFVTRAVGWPITVALIGYSVYEITLGEKPFVARIMIVEQGKVKGLCNG